MTTLWLVYDPGGRDDDAELYGAFTSKKKAERAADFCAPGGCLSITPVLVDAIYRRNVTSSYWSDNAFSYPQPEPNTDWDHLVVDGRPEMRGIQP